MIPIICLLLINVVGLVFLIIFGDNKNVPSRTEKELELIKKRNSKTKNS